VADCLYGLVYPGQYRLDSARDVFVSQGIKWQRAASEAIVAMVFVVSRSGDASRLMVHNSWIMKHKILLIGGTGQVGHALKTSLLSIGEVVVCTRTELDLSLAGVSPAADCPISALVSCVKPSIIVNATAYTAVDRAESETELAHTINAVAPGLLAKAAHAAGACLVHYSTDYVYAGTKETPYVETDETQPLSAYGRSKLAGEHAVAEVCPRHLIFRTSWVMSAHGGNFLKTMLKLAQERDALRVVADQVGAPTSADLIAETTTQILNVMAGQAADDSRWGVYHLTAGGMTNWHAYASYVIAQARAEGWPIKIADDAIAAIRTEDYPVTAIRPVNSCLNTDKLRDTFGLRLPDWRIGVHAVMKQLAQ
jgi:dTDP-4-dehydrorhamnose reductase